MSAPGADPLAAIRQRAEQATPGPWTNGVRPDGPSTDVHMCRVYSRHPDLGAFVSGACVGMTWHPEHVVSYVGFERQQCVANADFIAHAREDIPFLLKQWDTRESALRALVADMQDRIDYMHRDTDWYRAQELEYWKRKVERLLSGPQPQAPRPPYMKFFRWEWWLTYGGRTFVTTGADRAGTWIYAPYPPREVLEP